MIDEYRTVQEDGTLDLRGVIHIKLYEYSNNQSIKKVIIGSSVQKIDSWGFSRCHNLSELLFEEDCQIIKLEEGCFSHCSNLRKIDLPSSIQKIDSYAFHICPLDRIILRGAYSIEKICFQTNTLDYLHIADSIQIVNNDLFYRSALDSLSNIPCKIYIRAEFHDKIKRIFRTFNRDVEFIGNELEEGYVLK